MKISIIETLNLQMDPPLALDYPLLSAKNTILSPHIGYFTEEAMIKLAEIVVNNALAFIEGREENIIC